MTTPKKPAATGSRPGADDIYMELFNTHKLHDNDTSWMNDSKCHPDDGITWFPGVGERTRTTEAKQFCQNCPVKQKCLDWAITNKIIYGVWGGHSPIERAVLLHARKIKAKIVA